MTDCTPTLTLDPAALPLQQQVYAQIRAQILRGELPAGCRLPPTRTLAAHVGVARSTVQTAYDWLAAEGFVTTRVGAGTFVARVTAAPAAGVAPAPRLTAWAERALALAAAPGDAARRPEIDFSFGRSFAHHFPYAVWRRLLARYLSSDDALLARYGSPAGFLPLREALAAYLQRARGVRGTAAQLVIVNGVQQAIDIVARLVLQPGDEVLVETPGYVEAYRLLQVYGAQLRPLAVDGDGIPPAALPADGRPRLLFVTPANQFPRGGTLPLARRLALLAWAQQHNVLILEDDYDSELRYDGAPAGALQGIAPIGQVVYLGTFSKVLFPALRLAYVVLPPTLVQPFLAARRLIDRGSPTLMQAAIADFIAEGHFERHARQLRALYGAQRAALVAALRTHLPTLPFGDTPAGLHIMLQLPSTVDEASVVAAAEQRGVAVQPAAPYHLLAPAPPALLLAFSAVRAELIEEGIERLAVVIRQLAAASPPTGADAASGG